MNEGYTPMGDTTDREGEEEAEEAEEDEESGEKVADVQVEAGERAGE